MRKPIPSDTLEYCKKWLREKVKGKGDFCPCCEKFANIYNRKLNDNMSFSLMSLYRLSKNNDQGTPGWFHMSRIGTPDSGGGDFSKLRWWGLIKHMPDDPPEGKKSHGYWGITQKGRDFCELKITVESHAVEFASKCLGRTGSQVTIKDTLGEKFNYDELRRDSNE